MEFFHSLHFTDSLTAGEASKPALVMLHGFFMDHCLFKHQVACFQKTHRVICCDIRGFGRTEWQKQPFSSMILPMMLSP